MSTGPKGARFRSVRWAQYPRLSFRGFLIASVILCTAQVTLGQKPDDELINLSIEQLYESALVMEGLHPNPAGMLPRIQQIIELAATRSGT